RARRSAGRARRRVRPPGRPNPIPARLAARPAALPPAWRAGLDDAADWACPARPRRALQPLSRRPDWRVAAVRGPGPAPEAPSRTAGAALRRAHALPGPGRPEASVGR